LSGLGRFGRLGPNRETGWWFRRFGLPGARVLPMLCTVHARMVRMGWGWLGREKVVRKWCTGFGGAKVGVQKLWCKSWCAKVVVQKLWCKSWCTDFRYHQKLVSKTEDPLLSGLGRFGRLGPNRETGWWFRRFGLPGARVLPMLCTVHARMVRMGWAGQDGSGTDPGWSAGGPPPAVVRRRRCTAGAPAVHRRCTTNGGAPAVHHRW